MRKMRKKERKKGEYKFKLRHGKDLLLKGFCPPARPSPSKSEGPAETPITLQLAGQLQQLLQSKFKIHTIVSVSKLHMIEKGY